MEFALAMAEFALPDKPYSVERWLAFLQALAPGQEAFFDRAREALERARKGVIPIDVNGERMTAEQAYRTIATRIVCANDIDARAHNEELGLLRPILWQLYHSYCADLWDLLRHVHSYRRDHAIRPAPVERANHCIYCTASAGVFTHVEHTLPECFGNEDSFLPRGYVCETCKAALDRLEDGIHNLLPFSMLILVTRLGNKKGKLPGVRTPGFLVERKSPNRLVYTAQNRTGRITPEPTEDGGVKFSITQQGRLDPHRIARMLYKAALGAIALEQGRDKALDPRFDEVRRYVTRGGTFPNRLIMWNNVQPRSGIRSTWDYVEGTPVVHFNILGAQFLIALGAHPPLEPTSPLKEIVHTLDLSRDDPCTSVAE
jgi:hypothetical protein